MQIKKFKPQDHKIKALIYGPAGSGKTVFAGTAKKVLFASAEGGLLSIADKEPDFKEVKSLRDLVEIHSYLSNEEHEYETVVIDSITEINEIIKMEIERRTGHSLQLQDWGDLSKKIRDIFRKFRDLPMNVILVAQESYVTDEDKIRKVVPSLNGKAATEIAYFMDIVGYMHVEADGSRWIETDANRKYLTKDRSRMIGNDTDMDFAEWQKKVKKIKTGKQEVSVEYEAPVPVQEKTASLGTPHLDALKKKLVELGAKDQKGALEILTKLTNKKFTSFSFDEAEASKLLIALMVAKSPKAAKKQRPKKVSKK